MSLISIPNTFTVGAVIVASQHNSNFSTIYSDYNGNITNDNLSASATISDTKLAQITTAGKVSGAAFTSLTSIPSGAGLIPTANLGTGASSSKVLSGAQTYIDPTTVISGLLGSWVSKSANTVYQATTDGFAIGYASGSGGGGSVDLYSDSSNPPTTKRSGGASTTNVLFSFFSPVRKNDYYKFTSSSVNGDAYFFIPLGT